MTFTAADLYQVKEHSTNAFAHQSYLKGYEDLFYLLPEHAQILSILDVSVMAKERGEYTGSVEEMNSNVWAFLRETSNLLRDGYGVNLGGVVELVLKVGGFIKTPTDNPDPKENPVSLSIRRLIGASRLVEGIQIVNRGLAPSPARIEKLIDAKTGAMNDVVTVGGAFTIEGTGMKVDGTTTSPIDRIGVSFFMPGPPEVKIIVTENLIMNEPSKIIGIVPDLPDGKPLYVRICTRYSHGGTLLKENRVILSPFTVVKA
jgi:hypothetical protein